MKLMNQILSYQNYIVYTASSQPKTGLNCQWACFGFESMFGGPVVCSLRLSQAQQAVANFFMDSQTAYCNAILETDACQSN